MTRISGPIAALAAASGLALAGCGGSSHKATTPTSAATANTDPTTATHARAHRSHAKTSAAKQRAHPRPAPHPQAVRGHHPKPSARLTLSELRQRAGSACAAAKTKEGTRPGDFETNTASAASYLGRTSSTLAAEIAALHLNPPTSVAIRYSELFGDLLHQQILVGVAATQARSGQRTYVQTYASAVHYGQQAAGLARQLGLPSCE